VTAILCWAAKNSLCGTVTGVNNISGKFATGVNDTGGKFATGVNDTGGNLPSVSTTPVLLVLLILVAICHWRC
jgi:hypothetical protein